MNGIHSQHSHRLRAASELVELNSPCQIYSLFARDTHYYLSNSYTKQLRKLSHHQSYDLLKTRGLGTFFCVYYYLQRKSWLSGFIHYTYLLVCIRQYSLAGAVIPFMIHPTSSLSLKPSYELRLKRIEC